MNAVVEIARLNAEILRREAYEADLRLALKETKEELAIVRRTYDALLDEGEAAMAELAKLKSK